MKTEQALAWWQARPTREKWLLAVVSVAMVVALGDALSTAPLGKKLKRERAQAEALSQKLDALSPAGGDATSAIAQEAALRQRLTQAQARNVELRRQLAEAAKLPETLRAITQTVGSARLLALDLSGASEATTAAPALATAVAPSAPGAPGTPSTPGAAEPGTRRALHRLPITLKVAGSFAELQLLLTQIERHAQALQWASLSLDNSSWPAIELTLKAHVLSTEARWGAPS